MHVFIHQALFSRVQTKPGEGEEKLQSSKKLQQTDLQFSLLFEEQILGVSGDCFQN